jgi:hypothetical protein
MEELMNFGDAFDALVERYGGFVLLVIGLLTPGAAFAGYHRYLPPPFSAPLFPSRCLGCQQLTFPAKLLLYLGLFCLWTGCVALPHNRRNRQALRPSA